MMERRPTQEDCCNCEPIEPPKPCTKKESLQDLTVMDGNVECVGTGVLISTCEGACNSRDGSTVKIRGTDNVVWNYRRYKLKLLL